MDNDLIIIGGGAAGLFAGAISTGLSVLILEKKDRVGMKVMVSGGGMCNLTHAGYVSHFLDKYGANRSFVKPALNQFKNTALIAWLETIGVGCVEREDGKIFPESMSAKSVVAALRREIETSPDKQIITSARVVEIKAFIDTGGESGFSVKTESGCYTSRNVLLATGGKSYPKLGTEGDGYDLAVAMGHHIIAPKPALTGVSSGWISTREWQGLSIENAEIQLKSSLGSSKGRFKGDLLFTHFGLSGPVVLNNSRYMESGDIIEINLCGKELKDLEADFLSVEGSQPLAYWLNQQEIKDKLKRGLLQELKLSGKEKMAEISKTMRKTLLGKLTAYDVKIDALIGFSQAMVTAGGIVLSEIDKKTLASKQVDGLYFAGEVMDIDGDTGGYNLQWAFSSAYAAVKHIESR